MQLLSAATVFLSSLLLFLIQPLSANLLLPRFGGAASVWTTAMLFFPVVLFAGYAWSHWLQRWPPQVQRAVHAVVAIASLAVFPATITGAAIGPFVQSIHNPELQVLATLTISIGLPFFILSATSPLIQAWYARTAGAGLPYWLYAVSNAASLAALVAYPLVVEPRLRRSEQERLWSFAFLVYLALLAAAAFATRRATVDAPAERAQFSFLWLALSAVPSALWLAVANQMSHAVAPVPLLWILPLSVYLLTMVLCFSTSWYRPRLYRWLFPLAIVALCVAPYPMNWHVKLLLFLAGLFVFGMTCHGELYLRKPGHDGLTTFYMTLAAGGAAGAAFVSVLAPILFREYLELPVSIVASVLLAVALLYGFNQRRHVIRLAIVGGVALLAATGVAEQSFVRARNFYGAIEIRTGGSGTTGYRALFNGSILHGVQFLHPSRTREVASYYSPKSGVGMELSALSVEPRRIGIIGLGAGSVASYGRAGDVYRFYEINPLVIQVAQEQFTFLKESRATVEVVTGDARIELEKEPPQNFDVLVLDAFSGDAVPVHLLTREAFLLYARHLKAGGVIAAHVSSRYLKLAPLVIRVGGALGFESKTVISTRDPERQISQATWVLLRQTSTPHPVPDIWTDDYSNLLSVL